MVHDFDQLTALLGPARRCTRSACGSGPHGAPQHVVAVTSHPGGAGLAEGGMMLPDSYPFTSGIRVLGDAGVLEYPFAAAPAVDGGNIGGVDQEANRLRLHPADGAAPLVDVESADPWHRPGGLPGRLPRGGAGPGARHGRAGAGRTARLARGQPLAGIRTRSRRSEHGNGIRVR